METARQQLNDDVRQQILAAAEQRFQIYGYNKTTMAEIAKDCDMSAANLYRYFENKLAIGSALACRCLSEEISNLRVLIQETQKSAQQRLREFVHTLLEHTYSTWSERPKMNELVIAICNEKLSIVEDYRHSKHVILTALLKDGINNNEFVIENPESTAEAILAATVLFDMPLMMPLFSRQDFEQKVNQVVDLILNGVLKR